MEVTDDSPEVAAPGAGAGTESPAGGGSGGGGGLRLRPVKANRDGGGGSPENLGHSSGNANPPSAVSYSEDFWKDEPMTPAGRVFMEMNSHFVCVCILGFRNHIDHEKFKFHVESTIMKHKRFSSRVENRKGRPWWTQVTSSVDNHVFKGQLTEEQRADKDGVLNYTTDVVMTKPFDPSKPLWDMHLVDAKLGDAEGCCIIRIHHSLGDGTSLISLLLACSRRVDEPNKLPSVKSHSPPIKSSFTERFWSGLWMSILVFWHSLIEITKATATILWMKDSNTVITGFRGVEYSPRKYRFKTLRVDDFKYIGKAYGATINDVFMAVAAYGLRQYLERRAEKDIGGEEATTENEEPSITKKRKNVLTGKALLKNLDRMRIRAVALINMRASPGLQELSEMMNGQQSQARWGNHMGYLLLSLPMKRYKDPLELLQKVKSICTKKKHSLEGVFSYVSGTLLMNMFGQKAAAALVYRATLQTSLSLSNIKGPTEHVMFADNPIAHIIPSVVGHPHGLTLHLQSYNGEIALVSMSTKELIPDPEYLLELCIEGVEKLKAAVTPELSQK